MATADDKRPPNIVIVMADQLAPHFTGTYGHPLVQTPNMDAIAARGMRFDAAYCNSPLCAPSRFAFMSGQLTTRIAAYDNASDFPATIPTYAHYLRLMGYRTVLSGKMHFVGPDQLHGFDERLTTDVYPADYGWTPDWELPDERIDDFYHNMDSVREACVAVASVQMDFDEETAFAALRRINDFQRRKEHPFLLVASFTHPHDPYEARPEFWDLYDHDAIDMPAVELPYEEQDPFSQRILDGIEATGSDVTDEQVRNARHAYYANVSYFDSKLGQIVAALEETGQLDDTIIIVCADHGDMLGERGLWYKMNWFEHSARVPLLMAGPGVKQGTDGGACSLIDILPTLMDIASDGAGTEKPALGQPIDGRSLWPVATGTGAGHDEAIGEYCAEMAGAPVFMIRRGKWKYVHCDRDPAQLYDIEADPQELTNLAADPAHAEVSEAFAKEVAARWDSDTVKADVIATQKQRRFVHEALTTGARHSWDHNPHRDAANEYVRTHITWFDAAVGKVIRPGGE